MRRRQKLRILPGMIAAGMIFAALPTLLVVRQRAFRMPLIAAVVGGAPAGIG